MHASIKPLLVESQVSTSIDLPSTSLSSTISDDVYVNLVSQDDAPSTTATSCSHLSSHPPIFDSDEDIMEATTTLDYPWDDMHRRAYFLLYLESTTLNTSSTPIAYWGAVGLMGPDLDSMLISQVNPYIIGPFGVSLWSTD